MNFSFRRIGNSAKILFNKIANKKQVFALPPMQFKNLFSLFYILNSNYRAPLSYGIPSAFGACEFFDVSASIIIDAINGIIL